MVRRFYSVEGGKRAPQGDAHNVARDVTVNQRNEVSDVDFDTALFPDDGFNFDELIEQAYESGYEAGYGHGYHIGRNSTINPRKG